jgi:hypothetical protein
MIECIVVLLLKRDFDDIPCGMYSIGNGIVKNLWNDPKPFSHSQTRKKSLTILGISAICKLGKK